ncbi:MAG: hypothetical protein P9L89_01340, partial [Candidatus Celaenobacter polaris]|nr:hypothetical protein [Candidatus Celaenobacter polaris]
FFIFAPTYKYFYHPTALRYVVTGKKHTCLIKKPRRIATKAGVFRLHRRNAVKTCGSAFFSLF